jgi:hypothetical protein
MKQLMSVFWQRRWVVIMSTALFVATLTASYLSQWAYADQPHMQAALASLRTAREQLQKASDDKGGHRKKALALVQEAIQQVEKGIQFDRRH